jgi:hypothetical protein
MASSPQKTELSNNNLIIIMLLVTFLVVGITGLAANSLIRAIALNTKVLTKKSAADKQIKADVKNAPNLVEAYKALGPQGAILDDALPTFPDFPALLVTFENMSKDAGVFLKEVEPSAVVTPVASTSAPATPTGAQVTPSPQTVSYTVGIKGAGTNSYQQLRTMLDHIEKSARPMRITGVVVTGSSSSMEAQITLDTYYQDKSQLPIGTEEVK